MKFISTRQFSLSNSTENPSAASLVDLETAIQIGLAPDGGLFVPETFPHFSIHDFKNSSTLDEVASTLLKPFFSESKILSTALPEICKKTFHFPIPLTSIQSHDSLSKKNFILELYHGPTSAFKDIGARFFSECMKTLALHFPDRSKKQTVLVATSGDTGGAVAAAFFEIPHIEVVILYPKNKVSKRQEMQLCCWGKNVRALAVEGTFDDCQRMVKEAFLEKNRHRSYLSANSINLARILPQMVYYAYHSLVYIRNHSEKLNFIIPSGNLGNALACIWAKKMGLPIGEIALAFNANRTIPEWLQSGNYLPLKTIPTLANAMDVGHPSNQERLKNFYPVFSQLREAISAQSVSDAEIENEIKTSEREWGQALCPHTATAAVVRKKMPESQNEKPWALVATAHPAKFETIVEPLIGHAVPIPPALSKLLALPAQHDTIKPELSELNLLLDRSLFS